jgi:Flp pilus assembly protein TadD
LEHSHPLPLRATGYTRAVADDFIKSGLAHLRKADYDQAIADFDRAIALNPNSAVAYYDRGIAYRAKANADFNRATDIDPKIPRPTSS